MFKELLMTEVVRLMASEPGPTSTIVLEVVKEACRLHEREKARWERDMTLMQEELNRGRR